MCQRRWRGSAATFRAGSSDSSRRRSHPRGSIRVGEFDETLPADQRPAPELYVRLRAVSNRIDSIVANVLPKSRVELVSVAWNVDRLIRRQPFAQATDQCRDINAFRGKQPNPRQRQSRPNTARTKPRRVRVAPDAVILIPARVDVCARALAPIGST
jgi:hypothetical protein